MRAVNVDGHVCYSNSTDLAHRSIADQKAASPHRRVSLHAMWRACGEPTRKSPDQWVILARDLIDEIAALYAMFLDNRGIMECFVGEGEPGDEDKPDLAVFSGE